MQPAPGTQNEWEIRTRENFKIRREMIVHEDGQVNQRATFQLVAQSLLATAATQLASNNFFDRYITAAMFGTLCVAGLSLTRALDHALKAAYTAQEIIKYPYADNKESKAIQQKHINQARTLGNALPIDDPSLLRALQSEKQVLQHGRYGTNLLTKTFFVFWCVYGPLGTAGLVLGRQDDDTAKDKARIEQRVEKAEQRATKAAKELAALQTLVAAQNPAPPPLPSVVPSSLPLPPPSAMRSSPAPAPRPLSP